MKEKFVRPVSFEPHGSNAPRPEVDSVEQEEAEASPTSSRYQAMGARRKPRSLFGRAGMITMDEALHRYRLAEEEFLSWTRMFECHGHSGFGTLYSAMSCQATSGSGPF